MFGWLSFRKCRILVSAECWTFFTATNSWLNLPTKTAPCAPEPSHCRSEIPSKGISQSSGTKKSHILKNHWKNSYQKNRWLQILLLALPNLAITSQKYPQRELLSHLERNGHRFKIDFWLLYCYAFLSFFEVVLGIQWLSEFTIESVWTIFLWEHSYIFYLYASSRDIFFN